ARRQGGQASDRRAAGIARGTPRGARPGMDRGSRRYAASPAGRGGARQPSGQRRREALTGSSVRRYAACATPALGAPDFLPACHPAQLVAAPMAKPVSTTTALGALPIAVSSAVTAGKSPSSPIATICAAMNPPATRNGLALRSEERRV